MLKQFLLTASLSASMFLTSGLLTAQAQTMDEFYAEPANQAQFDKALAEGHIVKGRVFFVKNCQDALEKGQTTEQDCDCIQGQIAKISDKEFFYETILAYQEYQARVAVHGDAEKTAALKEQQSKRESLTKRIEQSCKPSDVATN
ncbi:hypothetical protein [Motilimonas eburnea]|uniref:hypothetical protein n=1 Tax=Motilimonas eburnea TaxID=1737488 RepID=UPI001E3F2518|nr:hypothetical protein [Motilimonas eburnea]MCE2570350.1 hypothetical protein [Motilimonas eburnea]